MKRLKKRTRADSHVSEARKPPKTRGWDRLIYLGLVAGFLIWLTDYVAGDRVFLNARGLVLQERTEIGATHLVRIVKVNVRPGQTVEIGDPLIIAESSEVLGRLIELSMRRAELNERRVRLQSQLQTAETRKSHLLGRTSMLQEQNARLEGLLEAGYVISERREATQDDLSITMMEADVLGARIDGLRSELRALGAHMNQASAAFTELQRQYGGGIHPAGISGTVGDDVPAPGEVFNPGDHILTLHHGEPYVLAYLPPYYLFELSHGDEVEVRIGRTSQVGYVQSILPMSAEVPLEFRSAFNLKERRQLARIRLSDPVKIPVQTSVTVSRIPSIFR